jgi:hypothetical protein
MRGACPLHDLMEVGRTWKDTSRQPRRHIAHGRAAFPTSATTPTSGRPRPHQGNQDTKCNLRHPFLFPLPVCFGTVGCGAWAHPVRLDFLPSAGTSLLDYKMGVPVARPHGGREDLERKATAWQSRCVIAHGKGPRRRQATHGKATTPMSGDLARALSFSFSDLFSPFPCARNCPV